MEFKDILNNAFNIATDLKYTVIINGILKEMTYMELGLVITTNFKNIDKIEITMKE